MECSLLGACGQWPAPMAHGLQPTLDSWPMACSLPGPRSPWPAAYAGPKAHGLQPPAAYLPRAHTPWPAAEPGPMAHGLDRAHGLHPIGQWNAACPAQKT